MRKIVLILLMITALAVPVAAPAASDQPVNWAWLVQQVASGADSVTLPNDIIFEGEEGLLAEGTVRIEGNGFALTGAVVDGGTIIFKDVKLYGDNGTGDEDGGTALTLRGDGAIAVLMGLTRAEGGRSGMEGQAGGDGVLMAGHKQGLILNNSATAAGATGHFYGGMGVRVTGCEASVLLTDTAALTGSAGIAEGGSGLLIPSCGKLTVSEQAAVNGGISPYAGGHGIHSFQCTVCDARSLISLGGMSMAIGGTGETGGHGIYILRDAIEEEADLYLKDSCMLMAGDGGIAGAALYAEHAAIALEGEVLAFGGRYYNVDEEATQALVLKECEVLGALDAITITEGAVAKTHPASGATSIINTALGQRSERYEPEIIEDGLATMTLETKLNGFTVDRGNTSQVKVSGNSLKIYMFTGAYEKRMQFQQHLMDDGEGGTRLVLTGAASDVWPTVEATAAGIRKLESIGITQLAYTSAAPVYHERCIDLKGLVAAMDAYGGEVVKVICGTADDAIIFTGDDGKWDYQETLMAEILRPIGGEETAKNGD